METSLYMVFSVLAILVLVSLVARARARPNLIQNGDMETVSGTAVSGWSLQTPAGAIATIRSVGEPIKGGRRALELKGVGLWMSAHSPRAAISEGNTYRASAWIRTRKGHARIQINHWAGDRWLGAADGRERLTRDEWQHASVDADPGRVPGVTHMSVGIVSDGPEVEIYVDEVMMTERPPTNGA